jgi:xanthosine utilization system XapX-like protein
VRMAAKKSPPSPPKLALVSLVGITVKYSHAVHNPTKLEIMTSACRLMNRFTRLASNILI